MTKFEEVMKVNVNDKTEKKGNLTYLSWAWAWAEFKKLYPDATYEVKKFDGLPYVHDSDTGYMVYTSVTADGMTYEMWLPVMDARNKTLMNATMFDINKTIMRCLAKNLAMFGLGLYIYAGEDLPEDEQAQKSSDTAPKTSGDGNHSEELKNSPQAAKAALRKAWTREILVGEKQVRLGDLSAETLKKYSEKTKDKTLRDDMLRVMQHKFTEAAKAETTDLPFKDVGSGNAEG